MSTLRHLTQYIESLPFVERDHFSAEQVGESMLIPSMTRLDTLNEVWLLYREQYDAALYFEAWTQPKELIQSHLTAWLLEHGGDRNDDDLGFPLIEPLKNDDHSFDLMVTLRFQECVYVTPDPAGDLVLGEKRWRRCLLDPDLAEDFSIQSTPP